MKPSSAPPTFPERIRKPADFAQFVRAMLAPNREPIPVPIILGVGVARDDTLCGFGLLDDARALTEVSTCDLTALADKLGAVALLLALALPPGSRSPAPEVVRSYSTLAKSTGRAGVLLVDCIAVCGDRWWSLRTLGS